MCMFYCKLAIISKKYIQSIFAVKYSSISIAKVTDFRILYSCF